MVTHPSDQTNSPLVNVGMSGQDWASLATFNQQQSYILPFYGNYLVLTRNYVYYVIVSSFTRGKSDLKSKLFFKRFCLPFSPVL